MIVFFPQHEMEIDLQHEKDKCYKPHTLPITCLFMPCADPESFAGGGGSL